MCLNVIFDWFVPYATMQDSESGESLVEIIVEFDTSEVIGIETLGIIGLLIVLKKIRN